MTLHADYDPDNIFAKIIRGDIPCVKAFEDDHVLSFMDVFPQSEGHTLVIPKHVEARNLLEMPPERIGHFIQIVRRIAIAAEAAFSPDGIIVTQFNGAAAGQTVFHLHFHIIPKYSDETLTGHASGQMADTEHLASLAKKIQAKL